MPTRIQNTEIYQPGEKLPAEDRWMRQLAHVMDDAIPIGPWSVGLDSVLGLIPGLGDMIGALISMLIVARAVQAGIPRVAVARMVTNIAIDTLVGSIPVLGDAFDVAYRSNLMNLKIYEEAISRREASTAKHWGFFIALFLVVAAGIAAITWGVIVLLRGAK